MSTTTRIRRTDGRVNLDINLGHSPTLQRAITVWLAALSFLSAEKGLEWLPAADLTFSSTNDDDGIHLVVPVPEEHADEIEARISARLAELNSANF